MKARLPIRRWCVRPESFHGVADGWRYSTNGFALSARQTVARDTRHDDQILRGSLAAILSAVALEPTTIDAVMRCFRGVKLAAKKRPLVSIMSPALAIAVFDARLVVNAIRNAGAEGLCSWGIENDRLVIRGDAWLVAVMGVYLRGARTRHIIFRRPKAKRGAA